MRTTSRWLVSFHAYDRWEERFPNHDIFECMARSNLLCTQRSGDDMYLDANIDAVFVITCKKYVRTVLTKIQAMHNLQMASVKAAVKLTEAIPDEETITELATSFFMQLASPGRLVQLDKKMWKSARTFFEEQLDNTTTADWRMFEQQMHGLQRSHNADKANRPSKKGKKHAA